MSCRDRSARSELSTHCALAPSNCAGFVSRHGFIGCGRGDDAHHSLPVRTAHGHGFLDGLHGQPLHPLSSRPTTKDPAERETEGERRDPGDALRYHADSGSSTPALSPKPHLQSPALRQACHRGLSQLARASFPDADSKHAARREHLVSASQRTHPRDLSTLLSPPLRGILRTRSR